MAELTAADVEAYTKGRLQASDPEVQRMLNAALAAARGYCGWHVSPLKTGDVQALDGTGKPRLHLRTLKVVAVTAVTEDDVSIDPADVVVSKVVPGRLRKKNRSCWSCRDDAIEVTMNHGFTEAEAADWRQAILSMVDQMSLMPVSGETGRSDADLVRKRVDDVEYQWSDGKYAALAEQVLFSVNSILDRYRILPV